MQLRTLSGRLSIFGIFLIWTVKFLMRPYCSLNEAWRFALGVMPNLVGSFLVPFAAYWLYTHPQFFNGRLLRFQFFSDARIVCCFGFLMGVMNEYLQLLPVFGRTFDYFDILFSAAGTLLAYAGFIALQRRLLPA